MDVIALVDADAREAASRPRETSTANQRARGPVENAQLVANVHALAPLVTFVKAASYLLMETRFSYVRQMILDDSAVVVQDD